MNSFIQGICDSVCQYTKSHRHVAVTGDYSYKQQQGCEEQVSPVHTRKLSLSDALAILSILVTIFFSLIQQLPDKQLDAIIEQQEVIIELERQQNAALINAIGSLSATVGRLSDEIEVLQDCLDTSTADGEHADQINSNGDQDTDQR